MARRRVSVPSVEEIVPGTQNRLARMQQQSRATGQTPSTGHTKTTEGTTRRTTTPGVRRGLAGMTYETALALQDARAGDDTALLDYQPTPSINPPRPRTLAAGYDRDTRVLRVRFRDGTPWEYYDVEPEIWRRFKRVKSPGRFINRVLNGYEYARGDF